MKKGDKGFGFVPLFLLILTIGTVVFVGWLVLGRRDKKEPDSSQSAAVTTKAAQNESSAQVATKTDPSASYLEIKDWGIRFKIPVGLSSLEYRINGDTAAFFAKPTGSSVSYRSDYEKFTNNNFRYAIGVVYRSKEPSMQSVAVDEGVAGKKLGDKYYYSAWAFSGLASGAACQGTYGDDQASCEAEAKVFALINQGDNALLNTIEQVN